AGALITSVYNTITPYIGVELAVKGIVAITIGGMGNTYGAILAGFLIGILETLTVAYGSASYRDALVFGLLVVILLVRPAGLLGTRLQERA
ncbi:MAG: branched-chain amino acid ABC transporter permease, partial [Chloroflexi bacterium]|nr:branched-chain amino acid ABC transporter permease [Chloroflexota bacterium]